jgi:hypothetical protein
MNTSPDRLYELLPAVYRQRDVDQGLVLQALLRIVAEQMNLLEADMDQLYDDWFIETCQEWVVPYIGDLVGYRVAATAGEPGDVGTVAGQQRNRLLYPRQDVANTISDRRRRGTLAILARQARDLTGWPARAVEFFRLLGVAQSVTHLHLDRGRTVDLRAGDALDRLGGAFEDISHVVDTRRLTSRSSAGRYNPPSVGLFVWRLMSYPVTLRQPYCQEGVGPQFYTFSALGNDTPLFAPAQPPPAGVPVTDELQVPAPLRRRLFQRRRDDCYGDGRGVQIWWVRPRRRGQRGAPPPSTSAPTSPPTPTHGERVLIPPENIIVADLTDWQYRTPRNKDKTALDPMVAVDPVLGRIAFPPHSADLPRRGIWVTYHAGFCADLGGGEYERPVTRAMPETRVYRVGEGAPYRRIHQALERWRHDRPRHAFIEITDSAVYVEQLSIDLHAGQSLELRAASGHAPVLRLLDLQTDQPDSLTVTGDAGSCFVLDGLLVTGRGLHAAGKLAQLTIRHSTLVPGWSLHEDCEPRRPAEPSLELDDIDAAVTITHSIVGSIQVFHDEVRRDPLRLDITDTILDATGTQREALGAPGTQRAHVALTIRRSTVFGQIQTHALTLAENTLFDGVVRVAHRQVGCVRFCYVTPGSRTPRRYQCQPDLVIARVEGSKPPSAERDATVAREVLRVRPQFTSVRYGTPTYAQLAPTCAAEIRRGADDESEMGVYHDLFQPQREANLNARLREFTPAGFDAAIIFVN